MFRRNNKKTIIIVIIISLLLGGCDTSSQISTEVSSSELYSPILEKTEDMGQEYIDSMTFVGDSNTAHLAGFGILKGGTDTQQVWIPHGSTITLDTEIDQKQVFCPSKNKYMTIPEAAASEKPEYLVISLGTNGIAAMNESKFKFCYKLLIDAVRSASPETKIIVQSIYPVTSWYKGFSNEKVDEANGWLIDLAKECNIKYIDTASVLKDSSGALREEYNSDHKDGYHINKTAAESILYYIRTHGYQ